MGRVCGCLLEVVTFKNRSTGGPFLFTGLQGINQWKIITASPTSAHGCLQEGSPMRGSFCRDLNGKILVFYTGGHLWEVVAHKRRSYMEVGL